MIVILGNNTTGYQTFRTMPVTTSFLKLVAKNAEMSLRASLQKVLWKHITSILHHTVAHDNHTEKRVTINCILWFVQPVFGTRPHGHFMYSVCPMTTYVVIHFCERVEHGVGKILIM